MKEEKAKEEKTYLQDLFEHMINEHGLTLLQSEMQDIIDICMQQNDYNPLSSQLTAYKDALREIIECTNDMEKAKTDLEYNIRSAERKVLIDNAKTLIE